jgi:hypothetical protein
MPFGLSSGLFGTTEMNVISVARGYAIGDIFGGGGGSNDRHLRSSEFVRLAGGGETNVIFLRLLSTWNIRLVGVLGRLTCSVDCADSTSN